jgi:hypothetical protein
MSLAMLSPADAVALVGLTYTSTGSVSVDSEQPTFAANQLAAKSCASLCWRSVLEQRRLRSPVALTSIPVKTPEGQAELSQRTRRLNQRQRTVLFLVDGKRTVVEVQTMALQAGAPPSCMDELIALGMVLVTQPTVPMTRYRSASPGAVEPTDIWIEPGLAAAQPDEIEAVSTPTSDDSELPSSRTMAPDSANGEVPRALSPMSALQGLDDGETDHALEEARDILLRAVRAEAPLAGSLTLLRLRRARTRDELYALLEEVEVRIARPQRLLAAAQTLRRVRQLLSGETEPEPPKF